MRNEGISNVYLEDLISLIEEREKELKLGSDPKARKEYYLLLSKLTLFHLEKGLPHNALGARRKKGGSPKAAVHDLFYGVLLPRHDDYGLSERVANRNLAALFKYAAGQIVKEYL